MSPSQGSSDQRGCLVASHGSLGVFHTNQASDEEKLAILLISMLLQIFW